MYCSDEHDDFYEVKENVDLSNINPNRSETTPISRKSSDESDKNIFVFNSSSVDAVNSSDIRSKSKLSNGSITSWTESSDMNNSINFNWKGKAIRESPVWCMDFCNDLIILGCSDGRLEFWEASSGKLMVRQATTNNKIYSITNIFNNYIQKVLKTSLVVMRMLRYTNISLRIKPASTRCLGI